MVGLVIPVLVVVVALALMLTHPDPRRAQRRQTGEPSLAAGLQRALEAGVLTEAQASAVWAVQPPGPPARVPGHRPMPVLGEALAYLGAVLVIVGAVVAVERIWANLPAWVQLGLVGAVAVGFWLAGTAIPEADDRLWWRLHGFCWLLATGAVALFTGLLAADVLGLGADLVALLVGGVVVIDSALLWQGHDRPLQHVSCYAGLVVLVVGAVTSLGGHELVVAWSLWALGAAWLALGTADRLHLQGTDSEMVPSAAIGQALGAGTVLVAASVTGATWEQWSAVFGLVTAVALVVLGSVWSRWVLLAFGVAGTFVYLPVTVLAFFAETVGVPLVLVLVGGALLGGVLVVTRRRSGARKDDAPSGSRVTAASPPAGAAPASRPPR